MGVDGGAYILSALTTIGYSNEQGFPRPPFAPGYLLSPFLYHFGLDIGYKLWASIFSIPPIFAIYFFSRIWLKRKFAIWVALFVGVDMSFAEMFVTGSLPLFALSIVCLIITCIIKSHNLSMSKWTANTIIIICIPLICISNQTSFAIMLYTIPLLFIILAIIKSPRINDLTTQIIHLLPQAAAVILGLIISLFFIDYYINPEINKLTYPGSTFYISPPADSAYWFNIPIGLAVAITTYRKTKSRSLKAIAVLLFLITLITPIVSYNEVIMNITYRSRYFQFFFIYPLLGYLVFCHLWPAIHRLNYSNTFTLFFYPFIRKIKYIGLVLLFLLAGFEFIKTFEGQTKYSDQITPAVLEAIEISGDKLIASNFSQAHWISAILKVEAEKNNKPQPNKRIPHRWSLLPSEAHQKEYHAINCIYGIELGQKPYNEPQNCNIHKAIQELNANYLLINTFDINRYTYPELKEKISNIDKNAWLTKVFEKNDVILYKITP